MELLNRKRKGQWIDLRNRKRKAVGLGSENFFENY